ncbi:MAG: NAD(P)H-dependent oxidoreductase, partial [Casimicrobium sp.]
MRCLVVIAHPMKKSLCASLAESIVETLRHHGHTVDVFDLYEQSFAPALTESERASYYREAFDRCALENEIAQLQDAET